MMMCYLPKQKKLWYHEALQLSQEMSQSPPVIYHSPCLTNQLNMVLIHCLTHKLISQLVYNVIHLKYSQ